MRSLIAIIRSWFAWRLLERRGAWTYTENAITGRRSAHQALHLSGPLDWSLLRPDDLIHWRDGEVEKVRRVARALAVPLAALAISGCADTKQWFASHADSLASIAAEAKRLMPEYCKLRPNMTIDDRALAAVALATSEGAADVIRSSVDKLCSWIGEPIEQKQAANQAKAALLAAPAN